MKKDFEQVYQFKIALRDIKPPIWRRILVPENMTFSKFSNAILKFMGWENNHLHSFYVNDPKTGARLEIGDSEVREDSDSKDLFFNEKKYKLNQIFSIKNKKASYIYDFGDSWEHAILLEKIMPGDEGIKYPVCIDGKRACPPEDVGGPPGYEMFLEAIKDPRHPEHEEMLEWIGGGFDPEKFEIEPVRARKTRSQPPEPGTEPDSGNAGGESVNINPEIILVMVTNILPMLPEDFENLLDFSHQIAEWMKPEPDEKQMEKILLELLAFDYFTFRVTTLQIMEKYPWEFAFLERAVKTVKLNQIVSYDDTLIKKLPQVEKRVQEYMSLGERLSDSEKIINQINSKMTGYFAGGKLTKEDIKDIENWAVGYMAFHFEVCKSVESGIEQVLGLQKEADDTIGLISEMRKHLPIPVDATSDLLKELKRRGASFKQMNALKIMEVEDSGDMGGIICKVEGMEKKKGFYVSLTHLRLRDGHPLKDSILKYQEKRLRHLMADDKRAGVKGKTKTKRATNKS